MTLINSTILAGLLLAAVPLILHLTMKARPKRIEFPALRLLKVRRTANSRRMRLRQILLLILRTLLIVTLVLVFARPSLPAANYSLRWWEWLGIASAAGLAVSSYVWLSRRDSAGTGGPAVQQQRQGRRRAFCLLGGLLAAVLLAGIPWGLRVRAELLSPASEGSEDIPIAAVFLIDNSISMKYRQENITRLDYAGQLTRQQLERFPAGSRSAILSAQSGDEVIFQSDTGSVAARLESLTTTAVPARLNRQLRLAIEAHQEDRLRTQQEAGLGGSADQYVREIYVFTDFSKSAWQLPDESQLVQLLTDKDWLNIYLVDVSVSQPVNAGLADLRLSEQSTVSGRDLVLNLTVRSTSGLPANARLEAILTDPAGRETPAAPPASVRLDGNASRVQLAVRIPPDTAWVEGTVRLASEDPLMDDNQRYFTVAVRPAPKVLLIADRTSEAIYLKNALQPDELERAGVRQCECRVIATAEAADQNFAGCDAVVLINPSRPDDILWNELRKYADAGGGVFVVAGSGRLQPAMWSTDAARSLLPATPLTIIKYLDTPGYLNLSGENGVTRVFLQDEGLRTELAAVAFDRCWAVEADPAARTLMQFTGPADRPALLERTIGRGRCLLFTSAMDNLVDGGNLWNNLPDSWSFLVLADSLLQYLTNATDKRCNYIAGEPVDLLIPEKQRFQQYLLRRPGLRQTRGQLEPAASDVLLTDAEEQGHYLLQAVDVATGFDAGFAVNFRDDETDLTKVSDDELKMLTGQRQAVIIHDPDQLQAIQRTGRLGVEVLPLLLGLLLLLFCAEHLMSNFFYDAPDSRQVPAVGGAGV
ncbi:MAG: BatA domain-containing protein [Planctomyces sp.]